MFGRKRRMSLAKKAAASSNDNSKDAPALPNSVASATAPQIASPVKSAFDFDLTPPRKSRESLRRPRTADGTLSPAPTKSTSLKPPLLPPIPRVTTSHESLRLSTFIAAHEDLVSPIDNMKDDGDNASIGSRRSVVSSASRSSMRPPMNFDQLASMLPYSAPASASSQDGRPSTAGAFSTTYRQGRDSTYSQSPQPQSPVASVSNRKLSAGNLPITRERSPLRGSTLSTAFANASTPNLLVTRPIASVDDARPASSSNAQKQPSPASIKHKQSFSSIRQSRRIVLTDPPMTSASPPPPIITIGTPYDATSSKNPLPQRVYTRPTTSGTMSSLAGVSVPTYHTTSMKSDAKSADKRRTRLLNPLSFMSRRKSGIAGPSVVDDRAERAAQAKALARQSVVATAGVNKLPDDFDPRIKGNVVHDFSAPRTSRMTSSRLTYYEPEPSSPQLQRFRTVSPLPDGYQLPRHSTSESLTISETGSRRNLHTPVFTEHFDDLPQSSGRISSLQAETLENKDFVNRTSALTSFSQDSSTLPPFARRSQTLDPLQASLFADTDSKRSSDPYSTKERNSTVSSISAVSPMTARSSKQPVDGRISTTPTSPASPDKTFAGIDEQHTKDFSSHGHVSSLSETLAVPVANLLEPLTFQPRKNDTAAGSLHTFTFSGVNDRPVTDSPVSPIQRGVSNNDHDVQVMDSADSEFQVSPKSVNKSKSSHGSDDQDETIKTASSSSRGVSKRSSAARRSVRSTAAPKHRKSNASGFSFQFGESTAEERNLEEKHRKIVATSQPADDDMTPRADEDEDDDYFDADAIDDMDELEVEEQHQQMLQQQQEQQKQEKEQIDLSQQLLPNILEHAQPIQHQTPSVSTSRSQSVSDSRKPSLMPSSDGEMDWLDREHNAGPDERDMTYAEHPAFRTHTALGNFSRSNSLVSGAQNEYWRDNTIDLYMRDSFSEGRASRPGSASTVNTTSVLQSSPLRSRRPSAPIEEEDPETQDAHPPPAVPVQEQTLPAQDLVSPIEPASDHARQIPSINDSDAVPSPFGDHFRFKDNDHARNVSGMSFSTVSDEVRSPQMIDDDPQLLHRRNKPGLSSLSTFALAEDDGHETPNSAKVNGLKDAQTQSPLTRASLASLQESQLPPGVVPIVKSAGITRNTRPKRLSIGSPNDTGLHRSGSPSSFTNMRRNNRRRSLQDSPTSSVTRNSSGNSTRELESSPRGSPRSNNPKSATLLPSMPTVIESAGDQPQEAIFKSNAPTSNLLTSGTESARRRAFAAFDFGGTVEYGTEEHPAEVSSENYVRSPEVGIDEEVPNTPSATNTTSSGPRVFSRISDHNSSRTASPAFNLSIGDDEPPTETHKPVIRDLSVYEAGEEVPKMHASWGGFGKVPAPIEAKAVPNTTSATAEGISQRPQPDREHSWLGQNLQYIQGGEDEDATDELYFDDGNFEEDTKIKPTTKVNEDAFDDGTFERPQANGSSNSMIGDNMQQVQDASTLHNQLANLLPAGQAYSHPGMLGAVQPFSNVLVGDAHLSNGGPSLDSYHAALAEAASKAAADGRFRRTIILPPIARHQSYHSTTSVGRMSIDTNENDEEGGELVLPQFSNDPTPNLNDNRDEDVLWSGAMTKPRSPPKLDFDFQFGNSSFYEENDSDDDLVAAANAEALASDDDGFYGQEFQFYGRPRAGSGDELQPVNGGYFGEDGDNGLSRNRSVKEPNLTPITERSEFSTRNSFIGLGVGTAFGPPSAGGLAAHSPALFSPLMEDEITSFDELRKLRANAFGGSNGSLHSRSGSNRSSSHSLHLATSPTANNRLSANPNSLNYFGNASSSSPMTYGYSNDSSGSSNPPNGSVTTSSPLATGDSPRSAAARLANFDPNATPRRAPPATNTAISSPVDVSPSSASGHVRTGSNTKKVSYVEAPDPQAPNKMRWVQEKRKPSDQGSLELIAREMIREGLI